MKNSTKATYSEAANLKAVADACGKVAEHLLSWTADPAHQMRAVTKGGVQGFRFTQVVVIDGVEYEVQVRTNW